MQKERRKLIIAYGVTILWMIIIFFFSSANGNESSNTSMGILSFTVSSVDKLLVSTGIKDELYSLEEKENIIEELNYPIRKLAHFSEYLILALLWLNALRLSKVKKKYLITVIICVLYAMTDEFHQTFTPGRVGHYLDVLIDSSGSITGTLFYYIVSKIKH